MEYGNGGIPKLGDIVGPGWPYGIVCEVIEDSVCVTHDRTWPTPCLELVRDPFTIPEHVAPFYLRQQAERQRILDLCRRHAHPGCNTGAHALACEIMEIMGVRCNG